MIGATRFHQFCLFGQWQLGHLRPCSPHPDGMLRLLRSDRPQHPKLVSVNLCTSNWRVNLRPILLVDSFFVMQHTVLAGTCFGFGDRIADNFPLPAQMGMVHTIICCIRHLWMGRFYTNWRGRLQKFKTFVIFVAWTQKKMLRQSSIASQVEVCEIGAGTLHDFCGQSDAEVNGRRPQLEMSTRSDASDLGDFNVVDNFIPRDQLCFQILSWTWFVAFWIS